jgi:hypothetical protein
MGDLIAGLAGAVLFIAVILALAYGVMILTRRAARASERQDAYAAASGGQWETATISGGGVTRVILHRVADGISGPRELERIEVASIRSDSPTWAQDMLNAQAEAEQRLSALRLSLRRKGT